MDLINKNIGEKIKSRRLRLGYSQFMLSELAHVSRDQISRIESGKINFTLATLFKICRALRIKPHKLLKDAEQEEYIKSGDLRPFVKWAGGKTQILDELMQRIPNEFNNYFEPFVGGGAFFLKLEHPRSVINDINSELMTAYSVIKDKEKFIALKKLLLQYEEKHNEEFYYEVRARDRDPSFSTLSDVEIAARFIYLNKSCFNGLYRVNSKGYFNVPFNKSEKVKTFDEDNINKLHKYLSLPSIKICCEDYKNMTNKAKKGDFVYFDPPYDTLKDDTFTAYDKEGFGSNEQIELSEEFKKLHKKGVKVMLSNHNTPLINELYKEFNITIIHARRAINSRGSGRGKIEEVIITNY